MTYQSTSFQIFALMLVMPLGEYRRSFFSIISLNLVICQRILDILINASKRCPLLSNLADCAVTDVTSKSCLEHF
jgi:hypothetical protein